MDIVKAGWLYRRTTILKNWKREWFFLTKDTCLHRVSSPDKQSDKADGVFQLNRWREMRSGSEQVPSTIEPPKGSTREQLMELVPSDGDTWTLCAESTDDLLAWQMTFEDVRQAYIERIQQEQVEWTNTQIPPNQSNFTYYQNLYGADYPYQTYRAADGSARTVILVDGYARDDITGVPLTGMAFDTFMFRPIVLVPIFPFM
jgi:hypothetical protein